MKTPLIQSAKHSALCEDKTSEITECIIKLCSHDMKSPISAILESCSLLYENSAGNSFQQALIRNMEDAVHSLYNMADQVHELIEIDSGLLPFSDKPIHIMECIMKVIARLHYHIQERGITVLAQSSDNKVLRESGAFYVRGDEFFIRTTVNWLFRTVISTVAPGSRISMELFNEDTEARIQILFQTLILEKAGQILSKFSDVKEISIRESPGLFILRRYLDMTGIRIEFIADERGQTSMSVKIPVMKLKSGESAYAVS